MGIQLDELNQDYVNEQGLDTHVINRAIPVTVGKGTKVFEIVLWIFIIPGLIFQLLKTKAESYLMQLQQKIQHNASQIDNYLEQRDVILDNCLGLIEKSINLDKSTYENIAKYRSGTGDEARNQRAGAIEDMSRSINIVLENYPELQAHQDIRDAMKQNMYLQREITAAREIYNDSINAWNREIFKWPTNMIVAAKNGYKTRIPFTASREVKERARSKYF